MICCGEGAAGRRTISFSSELDKKFVENGACDLFPVTKRRYMNHCCLFQAARNLIAVCERCAACIKEQRRGERSL